MGEPLPTFCTTQELNSLQTLFGGNLTAAENFCSRLAPLADQSGALPTYDDQLLGVVEGLNTFFLTINGALVFIMHAGFAMVRAGGWQPPRGGGGGGGGGSVGWGLGARVVWGRHPHKTREQRGWSDHPPPRTRAPGAVPARLLRPSLCLPHPLPPHSPPPMHAPPATPPPHTLGLGRPPAHLHPCGSRLYLPLTPCVRTLSAWPCSCAPVPSVPRTQ
jgi:hypothetical protein